MRWHAQKLPMPLLVQSGPCPLNNKSFFILRARSRSEWTLIQPKRMNILRPLSPHLPIFKPQLTSTFPIFHRISGAFLATLVLFFYIICLKMGWICFTYENFYQFFFYSSKLILISVEITALALSYHLYNGVRHLLTDFSGFLFLRIGRKRLKWLFQISPIPLKKKNWIFLWNVYYCVDSSLL